MKAAEHKNAALARSSIGQAVSDSVDVPAARRGLPVWRGLTVQLFVLVILPLTLLLLIIAFGSYSLHQRDMRALVGERDQRAVQSAAAAMESELHHRLAGIANLAAYADAAPNSTYQSMLKASNELPFDFDGGLAFLSGDAKVLASAGQSSVWRAISSGTLHPRLASAATRGPTISDAFLDLGTPGSFVVVSAYLPSRNVLAAGAFSGTPETHPYLPYNPSPGT